MKPLLSQIGSLLVFASLCIPAQSDAMMRKTYASPSGKLYDGWDNLGEGEEEEPIVERRPKLTARMDEAFAHVRGLGTIPPNAIFIFDVDDTAFEDHPEDHTRKQRIPQVFVFYQFLLSKSVKVIFLTARPIGDRPRTDFQLAQHEYISYLDSVHMPNELYESITADRHKPDYNPEPQVSAWKAAERAKLAEKYVILGTIDDRPSNLEGGNVGFAIHVEDPLESPGTHAE